MHFPLYLVDAISLLEDISLHNLERMDDVTAELPGNVLPSSQTGPMSVRRPNSFLCTAKSLQRIAACSLTQPKPLQSPKQPCAPRLIIVWAAGNPRCLHRTGNGEVMAERPSRI
jgi:hypothetical protein